MMKKYSVKKFKGLIMLCVILSTISGYSAAQSRTGIKISNYDPAKDEVVSKLVMQKIAYDLDQFSRLKITFSNLFGDWERLNREVERLNIRFDSLNRKYSYQLGKLKNGNESLVAKLEKAEKRAKGYRQLADKKSLLATKMGKYRHKYYAVLSIKVLKMALVMAPFTAVAIIATKKL